MVCETLPVSAYLCCSSLQGATKKFAYPLYVWSPAGGWWCNPRHWKRNTAIAFVVLGVLALPVAYASAQLEVCQCVQLCVVLY